MAMCLCTGAVPSELLGAGAVCGDGPTLPVLLLCAAGHLLVRHYLRHNGSVAPGPPEEG